ncbi:MAG: alpha-ribazole phosphatase family protein [Pseudomonadota bacterium]
MALTLVRHTTPLVAPGICYGQSDLPLAPSFEGEAQQVINALSSAAHIVTSPLTRCKQLAERLREHFGSEISEDTRLMEMDFGRWEGIAWDDIPRAELDAWAADFWSAKPHGGESVADVKKRCDAALSDAMQMNPSALIVTHAGIIKAAFAKGQTADDYALSIAYGAALNYSG